MWITTKNTIFSHVCFVHPTAGPARVCGTTSPAGTVVSAQTSRWSFLSRCVDYLLFCVFCVAGCWWRPCNMTKDYLCWHMFPFLCLLWGLIEICRFRRSFLRMKVLFFLFSGALWIMGGRAREFVELPESRSIGGILGPRIQVGGERVVYGVWHDLIEMVCWFILCQNRVYFFPTGPVSSCCEHNELYTSLMILFLPRLYIFMYHSIYCLSYNSYYHRTPRLLVQYLAVPSSSHFPHSAKPLCSSRTSGRVSMAGKTGRWSRRDVLWGSSRWFRAVIVGWLLRYVECVELFVSVC